MNKYRVGDKVWYTEDFDVCRVVIDAVPEVGDDGTIWYGVDNADGEPDSWGGWFASEETLYSTEIEALSDIIQRVHHEIVQLQERQRKARIKRAGLIT